MGSLRSVDGKIARIKGLVNSEAGCSTGLRREVRAMLHDASETRELPRGFHPYPFSSLKNAFIGTLEAKGKSTLSAVQMAWNLAQFVHDVGRGESKTIPVENLPKPSDLKKATGIGLQ